MRFVWRAARWLVPLVGLCGCNSGDGGGAVSTTTSSGGDALVVRSVTLHVASPYVFEQAVLYLREDAAGTKFEAVSEGPGGAASDLATSRRVDPQHLPPRTELYVLLKGVHHPEAPPGDAVLACLAGSTTWEGSREISLVCDAGTTAVFAVGAGGLADVLAGADPRLALSAESYAAWTRAAQVQTTSPERQVGVVLAAAYAALLDEAQSTLRPLGVDPLAVLTEAARQSLRQLSGAGVVTTREIVAAAQRGAGPTPDLLAAVQDDPDAVAPLIAAGFPGLSAPELQRLLQPEATVLLDPSPPPAPEGLAATPTLDGAEISWVRVATAERYRVYLDGVQTGETDEPRFTLTHLGRGISHAAAVASVNFFGESAPAEVEVFALGVPRIAALTGAFTEGAAVLGWDLANPAEVGAWPVAYRVLRDSERIGTTEETSYIDHDVFPGQTALVLTYTVIPEGEAGEGLSASTTVTLDPVPPEAPRIGSLTAALQPDGSVLVEWTLANPDPTGPGPVAYRIARDGAVLAQVLATSYVDAVVPAGSRTYAVTPIGDAGEGPTLEVTVTKPEHVAEAPRIGAFEGMVQADGSVLLAWTLANPDRVGSGLVTYQLTRDGTPILFGPQTSFTDAAPGAGLFLYTLTPAGDGGQGQPASITVSVP